MATDRASDESSSHTEAASVDTKSTSPTEPSSPKGDFDGDIRVSQSIPSKADLKQAADLPILDVGKKSHAFKSLYSGERGARRILVLFIRHFFCGNCQEYLRTLSSSISPEQLLALPNPTEIVVIGCGRPDLIPFYAEATNCRFPIYADPTKKLYDVLGMARTLNLGPSRPEYVQKNLLTIMAQSVYQGLANWRGIMKGGDYWQVGGEFLFENGQVTWCHRMKNTRDHAALSDLRKKLGLDEELPPSRTKSWGKGLTRSLSNRRQSWSRSRSRTKDNTKDSSMEEVKEEKEEKEESIAPVKGDPVVGNEIAT